MSINYESKDIDNSESMIRDDTAEKDADYRRSIDADRNNNNPQMTDQDDERDRNSDEGITIENADDTI